MQCNHSSTAKTTLKQRKLQRRRNPLRVRKQNLQVNFLGSLSLILGLGNQDGGRLIFCRLLLRILKLCQINIKIRWEDYGNQSSRGLRANILILIAESRTGTPALRHPPHTFKQFPNSAITLSLYTHPLIGQFLAHVNLGR
jgi:hypothetical protein